MRFVYYLLVISITTIIGLACSTGGGNAVTQPEAVRVESGGNSTHQLWGLYQFTADPVKQALDVTPLRAADLHLDSPLVNLDRYAGAPVDEIRGATRQALDNLVELAIGERVRFVIIAGDLFDGDCRDFSPPLYLRKKMTELEAAKIDVFIVQGNHDAQSKMRKAFKLQLPANVRVFPTRAPDTFELPDVQVALHGQGFATEAVYEDLSAGFPEPRRGWLNVGVLHTTVGGYEGRDNYAPSTVEGLVAKGYDYWGLGHSHAHAVVRAGNPWIVYSGCVQGRHINEEGAKGCTLVSVEGGQVASAEPQPLDVLRWARCTVDASGCSSVRDVVARVGQEIDNRVSTAEGRLLALRIELTGNCAAHAELTRHPAAFVTDLRELTIDRFGAKVWLESVRMRTRTTFADTGTTNGDLLASLVAALSDPEAVREAVADIRDDLDGVLDKIPRDPRVSDHTVDLDCPDALNLLAEDVKQILIPLLQSGRQES